MPDIVSDLRAASRELVRELGFMNRTIANTDLSATSVLAIIEIGALKPTTAKDLCHRLLLEKSTISRLVKSLLDQGLVKEQRAKADSRRKVLHLTAQGKRKLNAINSFAEEQVQNALASLPAHSQRAILSGLKSYAHALSVSRDPMNEIANVGAPTYQTGTRPGLIGAITETHANYYDRKLGLGLAFEVRVASELAEFFPRLAKPTNELWTSHLDGKFVGGIAVDGESLAPGQARLRWFIVDQQNRGMGIGRTLLDRALAFCDAQGFAEVHLWTIDGLDAARRLYEGNGFVLAEELVGTQWGIETREQKFIRKT